MMLSPPCSPQECGYFTSSPHPSPPSGTRLTTTSRTWTGPPSRTWTRSCRSLSWSTSACELQLPSQVSWFLPGSLMPSHFQTSQTSRSLLEMLCPHRELTVVIVANSGSGSGSLCVQNKKSGLTATLQDLNRELAVYRVLSVFPSNSAVFMPSHPSPATELPLCLC